LHLARERIVRAAECLGVLQPIARTFHGFDVLGGAHAFSMAPITCLMCPAIKYGENCLLGVSVPEIVESQPIQTFPRPGVRISPRDEPEHLDAVLTSFSKKPDNH
jgi:hypothetical protein